MEIQNAVGIGVIEETINSWTPDIFGHITNIGDACRIVIEDTRHFSCLSFNNGSNLHQSYTLALALL